MGFNTNTTDRAPARQASNVIPVFEEKDFGLPIGGVIEPVAGKVYMTMQPVSFSGQFDIANIDRLSPPMFTSSNKVLNVITSTGSGGALFINSNPAAQAALDIDKISFTNTGSRPFMDISSDSRSSTIVQISDTSVIDFDIGSVLNNMTGSFTDFSSWLDSGRLDIIDSNMRFANMFAVNQNGDTNDIVFNILSRDPTRSTKMLFSDASMSSSTNENSIFVHSNLSSSSTLSFTELRRSSASTGTGVFFGDKTGSVTAIGDASDPTWTIQSSAADNGWFSVTYGKGLFVAVADTGTNRVMTSPDGVVWTSQISPVDNDWMGVAYGNDIFVAVSIDGDADRVMTSPDGINWTSQTSAADNSWFSVTFGNGLFVAVSATGPNNRVMTSPDGITWTSRASAADNSWLGVTYGNGLFVAVAASGTNNRVMTSPDAINWTIQISAADNVWESVTYGNGLFVAVAASGIGNRVMTSPDGINWTTRSSAADNSWFGVTYGNGLFVAVSGGGTNRVMASPDGIVWTIRISAADNTWEAVAFGNDLFVAVSINGAGNRVMTSPDNANILATAAEHRVENGDTVTHTDFPDGNYNGPFTALSVVPGVSYAVTAPFGADEAGTWSITSLDTTNPRIDSSNNSLANLKDSMTLAEVRSNGLLTVEGAGNENVFVPVAGIAPVPGDWIQDDATERFLVDTTTGLITYIGLPDLAVSVTYKVMAEVSGQAQDLEFSVFINEEEQTKSTVKFTVATSETESYIGGFFNITNGDRFHLHKNNTSNESDTNVGATILISGL